MLNVPNISYMSEKQCYEEKIKYSSFSFLVPPILCVAPSFVYLSNHSLILTSPRLYETIDVSNDPPKREVVYLSNLFISRVCYYGFPSEITESTGSKR